MIIKVHKNNKCPCCDKITRTDSSIALQGAREILWGTEIEDNGVDHNGKRQLDPVRMPVGFSVDYSLVGPMIEALEGMKTDLKMKETKCS